MCLQVIFGSGFPLAKQKSEISPPSFTVMSDEMSYIFGGTEKKNKEIRVNLEIYRVIIDQLNSASF